MSVLGAGEVFMLGAADEAPYVIPKSLRFNDDDQAYLAKPVTSVGDQRRMTFSFWIKRHSVSSSSGFAIFAQDYLTSPSNAVVDRSLSMLFDGDRLELYDYGASSGAGNSGSVQAWTAGVVQEGSDNVLFRDPSAWYSVIFAIDTTQSTAANRCKVWINGVQRTMSGYPIQNSYLSWGQAKNHYIGIQKTNGSFTRAGDFSLADVHFIDGRQLSHTDFGEFDSKGIWRPKEYTGSYGPVVNQTQTWSSALSDSTGFASGYGATKAFDGIATAGNTARASTTNTTTTFQPATDIAYTSKVEVWTYFSGSVSLNGGSAVTVSNDQDWRTIATGSGTLDTLTFTGSSSTVYLGAIRIDGVLLVDPGVTVPHNGFHLNFSDSSTNEALGFDSAPTIPDLDPKKGMDVITYSGSNSPQNIGGLNFEPGLVWIKRRTGSAKDHCLVDVVRGPKKRLRSDSDAQETTEEVVTAFDPGGFTIGTDTGVNQSGYNFVAWSWAAGGAAVANDSGTIDAEVSANTDYGFSVVKWTATNTSGTIGHGLTNQTPKFILVKSTAVGTNWVVYHHSLGNTKGLNLNLNGTGGTDQDFWNNTSPTTSVFSVGNFANYQTAAHVAYVWSEVSGYSKFGTYEGASTVTVTTGFKPRWIILKNVDASGSWSIFDSERDSDLEINHRIYANENGADGTNIVIGNFTNTGFTLTNQGNSNWNTTGDTFVYAAFADRPGNSWDVNNIVTNEGLATNKDNFDILTFTGNAGTQTFGGTVYSDTSTLGSPTNAFNGDTSNGAVFDSTGNSVLTAGSITITSSLEIFHNRTGSDGITVNINGTNYTATGLGSNGYHTIPIPNSDLPLTTTGNITIKDNVSGAFSTVYAVRVDSTVLLDNTQPGLSFQPDLVWIKSTSHSYNHYLWDSVRGATKYLMSHVSNAEATMSNGLTSFNSDGFTLGSDSNINYTNRQMVAWCWKAGDAKIPLLYGTAATVSSTAGLSTTLIAPATPNGGSESINYQNLDIDLQEDVTTVSIKVKHAASPITYLVSADGTNWTSKSTGNNMTALSTITISHSSAFRYVRFHYPSGNFGQGFQVINNTDGSLASTVKADSKSGFSVVSYLGTGSAETVGHGLTEPPSLIIVKQRDGANSWAVYSRPAGASGYLSIEDSSSLNTSVSPWNNTDPTSSVFSIAAAPGNNAINRVNLSGKEYVAYCFANVPGRQRIGQYTGTGTSSGPTVITGFRPKLVMTKCISTDNGYTFWEVYDSVRSNILAWDINDREGSSNLGTGLGINFLDNGFQIAAVGSGKNLSGQTYMYLAIGDDEIGSDEDCLVDVPNAVTADADVTDTTGGYQRGNYATINPLVKPDTQSVTLSNGNLKFVSGAASGNYATRFATIGMTTGKWYAEFSINATANGVFIGIAGDPNSVSNFIGSTAASAGYLIDGRKANSNSLPSYGSSWGAGDVVSIAFDADAGSLAFYVNGVSQGEAYAGLTSGPYFMGISGTTNVDVDCNFGQQKFKYGLPSGYAALNTTALPPATIEDGSAQFETVLWDGDSASPRSITGLKFSPDIVYMRPRNYARNNTFYDTIRGAGKKLYSDGNDAEDSGTGRGYLSSFDSAGFTLTDGSAGDQDTNNSSYIYVGWCWNAGENSDKTYTVKVVSDSGNKYRFDDFGTSAVTLDLAEGSTYVFDQSDSSNAGHPLRFSTTSDGTHNSGTEYTTGVTTTGTPGSAGAKTTIVVGSGVATLYYYCSAHGGMGGQANTNSTAGASNFDGSLQATVKANPEAGFSIVKVSGPSSAGFQSVGHGLNAKPELIICKDLDNARNWSVYHKDSQVSDVRVLPLNQNVAAFNSGTATWDISEISTTTFTPYFRDDYGASFSADNIAYCFASVAGYSLVSSYQANGSDDGTFVYCGFRPKFIIFRGINYSTDWLLVDTSRDPDNPATEPLFPNRNYYEGQASTSFKVDILSNGFKLRHGDSNAEGYNYITNPTHIFYAVADKPFQANGGLAR